MIQAALIKGFNVWHIVVKLVSDCLMKAARAYIVFNNLRDVGEVVKTIPSTQEIEEENLTTLLKFSWSAKKMLTLLMTSLSQFLKLTKLLLILLTSIKMLLHKFQNRMPNKLRLKAYSRM